MPKICTHNHSHTLMCFVQDSLAKLLVSQENDWDLKIPEALSFLRLLELQKRKDHLIYSLKTLKGYSLTTKGEPLVQSSPRLMKWGMMQNGKCLTANISFHRTGNVSSLSDILEENVPDKYFLSETSIESLIKRNSEQRNFQGHDHIVQQSMPTTTKALTEKEP